VPGALKDQPVLLLHGFGQTGQVWRPVVELLDEFDCICPDLPGHGAASNVEPISPDSLVSLVLDLASGENPPLLIGYSMGGRLALRAAISSPNSFSGLVLVSTTAGIESNQQQVNRIQSDERLASLLEEGRVEEFEAAWRAQPIWAGDNDDLTERAARNRRQSSGPGLARSLRGFGAGRVPPVWDQLGKIVIPATIVAGARDTKYVGESIRLNKLITNSELEIAPNCGHSLLLESPTTVADAIRGISLRLQQEEQ